MGWRQTKAQRHKLYRAEKAALGFLGFFASVEACQGWVDRKIRTKWWKDNSTIRSVLVRYPSYIDSGAWRPDPQDASHGEIELYASRLCEQSATHELAHLLSWTPGKDDEADHGPEFAGALIEVTKRFVGAEEAQALRDIFDERKIAYTPWSNRVVNSGTPEPTPVDPLGSNPDAEPSHSGGHVG